MAAVLKAAKSGAEAVRLAAIRGLERSGNGSCLPVLLDTATESARNSPIRPWRSWPTCPARKWTLILLPACRKRKARPGWC